MTHVNHQNGNVSLGDDFHTYGLYWNSSILYTYIDSPTNVVLSVDFTKQSMWTKGLIEIISYR